MKQTEYVSTEMKTLRLLSPAIGVKSSSEMEFLMIDGQERKSRENPSTLPLILERLWGIDSISLCGV